MIDLQLALVANSELELTLGEQPASQRTTWILNEKGLERHVINK